MFSTLWLTLWVSCRFRNSLWIKYNTTLWQLFVCYLRSRLKLRLKLSLIKCKKTEGMKFN